MYFTDKTQFTSDIFIPNVNEDCENLNIFGIISEWEKVCLINTFGPCLFDELEKQLEWSEANKSYVLKSGIDEKWDRLVNGHSYENTNQNSSFYFLNCGCNDNNCSTSKWKGIKTVIDRRIPEQTIKSQTVNGIKVSKSYTAYYIYWLWSLNGNTFTSSTGENVAQVKGSTTVDNTHKRINAHNKFVSWVTSCGCNGNVGLYKFLQDFKDDFPTWEGQCLSYESVW